MKTLFWVVLWAPWAISRPIVKLINHAHIAVPYLEALRTQQELVEVQIGLQQHEGPETTNVCAGSLYILQHTPVYTLGTTLGDEELPLRPDLVAAGLEFEVHRTDRAGEATFHG